MSQATQPLEGPPPELRFRLRISFLHLLRELWRGRELVRTLAERDLRARYKQTVIGFAWALVTPVTLMIVFTVFFKRVAKIDPPGDVPYALFSYVGLLPWSFFSSSVSGGGTSLLSNMSLLNKVYCPREVFPIASTITAAVDNVIAVSVLGLLFVINGFAPKATSVWIPVILVVQVAFTVGVAFILSSTMVYVRDLRQALPILMQMALFATPVAYGLEKIPEGLRGIYPLINPLVAVIENYRRTILYGQSPDWGQMGLAAITSFVLLFGGYVYFKKLEPGIADVV